MKLEFKDIVPIIAALIAFAGTVISKRMETRNRTNKSRSRSNDPDIKSPKRIKVIKRASYVLLTLAFIGFFLWRYWNDCEVMINITYPKTDNYVDINEAIKGISNNIKSGKMIWIIVYSHRDEIFYPNRNRASIEANGTWTSPNTTIGASSDSSHRFDIIALLIDANSQNELQDYFNRPDEKRIGLQDIPKGAIEHHRITVIRR